MTTLHQRLRGNVEGMVSFLRGVTRTRGPSEPPAPAVSPSRRAEPREVGDRDAAVEETMQALLAAVSTLQERFDRALAQHRAELRMLGEALRASHAAALPGPGPHILGGTVVPPGDGHEIDLTEPIGVGALVEARSRFSEEWYGGFEVAEVISTRGSRRYRLTRRRDGRTLPILFGRDDVRPAEAVRVASESDA
jgi:hypothetical protein